MSMKANILTDSKGNITVQLEGAISYETMAPFKKELINLTEENPACFVTLDFQGLDFVGSSGIGNFVAILIEVAETAPTLRLSHVRAEFERVFKLYQMSEEMIDTIIIRMDEDEAASLSKLEKLRKSQQIDL